MNETRALPLPSVEPSPYSTSNYIMRMDVQYTVNAASSRSYTRVKAGREAKKSQSGGRTQHLLNEARTRTNQYLMPSRHLELSLQVSTFRSFTILIQSDCVEKSIIILTILTVAKNQYTFTGVPFHQTTTHENISFSSQTPFDLSLLEIPTQPLQPRPLMMASHYGSPQSPQRLLQRGT